MYLANKTTKRTFMKYHTPVILVYVLKYTPQCTAKKTESLSELKKQVELSPTLLSTTGAVTESAPVLPPLPPVTAVAVAGDLEASNNGLTLPFHAAPIQLLQATVRANNSNAHWLYFACKDAVVTMQLSLAPMDRVLCI